jgi:hypothetical protein
VKIYNNAFINASDSAIDFDYTGASSVGNIKIYNNLFKRDSNQSANNLATGIRIYRTSDVDAASINDIYILNNTFVDHGKYRVIGLSCNGKDPLPECIGTTATNVFIQNNLIYNSGNRVAPDLMAAVWIRASTGWTAADFNFAYNLINQGATGSSLVCIDDNVCNAETSYTQTDGQTGIPAFSSYTVRVPGNDFHLTSADTAARDQGTNLSSYFSTDKDGVSRPQGSAWDIGAYEYVPGGDTTRPAVPTGLRVN